MLDASSPSTPGGHSSRGDGARFVRRVVEQLDFEAIARIVEGARRVDQPTDDVRLVVDGQLHGDRGQIADPALRHRYRRPPQPAPEHHQPVCPEGQEKHQHQGVRERGGERDGPAGVSGVTQRFLHRGRLGWFLSIIRACTLSPDGPPGHGCWPSGPAYLAHPCEGQDIDPTRTLATREALPLHQRIVLWNVTC